jgi:hypothetical protein
MASVYDIMMKIGITEKRPQNARRPSAIAGCRKRRMSVAMFRRSSSAVATSREGHRSPRSGQEGQRRQSGLGPPPPVGSKDQRLKAMLKAAISWLKFLQNFRTAAEQTAQAQWDYYFKVLGARPLDI